MVRGYPNTLVAAQWIPRNGSPTVLSFEKCSLNPHSADIMDSFIAHTLSLDFTSTVSDIDQDCKMGDEMKD
jgi:hypothetical protein